jgi:anti-sigma regulatory factor (Ser/Thr protein kinase)
MAVVDVSFSALPSHVRTARLVALAVARRVGVPDDLLDEVRLAVGEACSRAVGVHSSLATDAPVSMRLSDDHRKFTVEVSDVGPLESDAGHPISGPIDTLDLPTGLIASEDLGASEGHDEMPPSFGLVVIGGLVEGVEITGDAAGTHVKMAWPTDQEPARIAQ